MEEKGEVKEENLIQNTDIINKTRWRHTQVIIGIKSGEKCEEGKEVVMSSVTGVVSPWA